MAEVVHLEIEDGIAIVTIDRPEARNAINDAVAAGISAAMDALDSREDLRAGILTGAGGTFCSGMDLKAFLAGQLGLDASRGFGGLTGRPPEKPLIAAVEGYALAGGCELALACDLIVASREARFGLPEVKRGLAAAAGGLLRLPRQIPPRIAMEMILTGEPVTAERAAALGLVNRVAEPGAALATARELARSIARNGPLAVRMSKRVAVEAQDWSSAEMFERQKAITDPIMTSADAREGARAFAEKREPVWTGR